MFSLQKIRFAIEVWFEHNWSVLYYLLRTWNVPFSKKRKRLAYLQQITPEIYSGLGQLAPIIKTRLKLSAKEYSFFAWGFIQNIFNPTHYLQKVGYASPHLQFVGTLSDAYHYRRAETSVF